MKIVIVEDNRLVLDVLKASFDAVGTYELSDFETAAEGLNACRNGADLAIFDHRLPDMKGVEAIRLLRSDAATRHLPIIMITADDDPGTRMDAIQAGATDFLRKPVNIEELRIRVRNLLALQQARKNAAQRETLLKTVIAASGTSLAVIEAAAHRESFIFASEGFLQATGLCHDDLIGKGVDRLWRAFPQTDTRTRFEQAVNERSAGRFVLEIMPADGVRAWADVALRPVPQPGADATYLVVTLEDISDLVSAREANRQLFDRMSDIASVSGAWFFETDSDSRLTYISDTMAFGLGYSPEEILGMPVDSLPLEFNDPHKKERGLGSLFKPPHRAIENAELTLRRSAAATRNIQISAVPFYNSVGVFAGFRGSASDVSSIAAARDAAARASRAKSAFLATMSHEMQTPLTAIVGMADILIDTPQSSDNLQNLRTILEAAQGLSNILGNVLDLAALDNETIVLREAEFDLIVLLDEVIQAFQSQAEAKGLEYDITLDGPKTQMRRGDRKRVRQVFEALLSNAVKFTETGRIQVSLEASDRDEINLIVTDTGIGMAAAEIDGAFEPFVQLDDSIARRFDGGGMGLSIARGLAIAMSGRLEIQSTRGQGTTAKAVLRLPCARIDSAATPQVDLQGLRILVADDNAANRKILHLMLHKLGAQVTLCDDGDTALDAWQQDRFDLLLLDINMPKMAGTDVIRKIRQIESVTGHARVPAIAVTANAAADQVSEYMQAGFDNCVGKPFTTKYLSRTLSDVMSGEATTFTNLR